MMNRVAWLCAGLGVAACGSSKPPLPSWDKTLPESVVMGDGFAARGLVPARGIVHLHSPYSHDACDNMPRSPLPLGTPNEACLTDLRTALCLDRIDYAALTDHHDTMEYEEFPTLFNMRGSDEAVLDASGNQIASHITCDDGHVVTVTVGTENDLMPVMMHRHVPGTQMQREAVYTASDPTAVAALRDAGALVWIAHTEQHAIDQLRLLQPDGLEVYNLHANIAPDIRSTYLGLDPSGAIDGAVQFADTTTGHPEPDLALLSFLQVNQPAVDRWNQVLADGRHVPATAGSDAHENALPIILADGERGDSYRRVLRWFSNVVLVQNGSVQDAPTVQAALGQGRLFAVFEMMGTPKGFDVHAVTHTGIVELGDTAPVGSQLVVEVPSILGLDKHLPTPEIHATVIRIDASGPTVVATGDGPELDVTMSAPGAYRVEITMVPHHLGPYLHDLGTAMAEVELPWIYASPIYVH